MPIAGRLLGENYIISGWSGNKGEPIRGGDLQRSNWERMQRFEDHFFLLFKYERYKINNISGN